ncbi:MAG TPA: histidine kinase dimerization/phospho-acceptor domain-containing protein, partial [Pyrinomonadaceae bacterium]|nr:histidine kinase dimerization/phospho-acceptor domain-containing protein [Pyrinomonadaceae bacterium]
MLDSVRTRLTLWYAGVLALSLIAFAFLVYYAASAIFYERQDESLRSTAQTVASAYVEEFGELHSLGGAGQVVLAEISFPNHYVQITDGNGHPVASSKNATETVVLIPSAALEEARKRGSTLVTVNGLRVAVVPISQDRELGFATVAEPLSVIDDGLRRLRRDFFAGVPLILLFASAGGYFLARKSLLPIASMNRQTQRISAGSLSSRLDVTNPRDEIGRLATTINDLLARLETSFKEQQRFIADASHELRTPLAVLRGETEVSLAKARTVDEYQDSLSLIKDEAERLSRIVEDLFILARQPINAPAALMKEPLSLNEAVRDCARAAQVLAVRKGVRLKTESDSADIVLEGDEELLKRMILNLLDNAVKYTPAGGEISIALARQNGNAQIVVRDSGIGISQADQLHVFDRFY